MISRIVGYGGQAIRINGLPVQAPLEIPFIITGGSNLVPKYTNNLGATWNTIDVSGFGTPSVAIYGNTGEYKHTWSYDGIHMAFVAYNVAQTVSRVWYTNDGGQNMLYKDLTDIASYNARQFITWTPDNNKIYITGWTNVAKVLYSTDNLATIQESSTGQGNGNYPLGLAGSKNGQYIFGGAGNSGGVIVSNNYGASFTLNTLSGSGHTNTPLIDDTGQYGTISGYFGYWMTTNYGVNWNQIFVSSLHSPYMFYDATLICYVTRTGSGDNFYFTTNQGGSWTTLAFPAGVTNFAFASLDDKNKVVYLYQPNVSSPNNKLWKLNNAKNGWDDVGTFANKIALVGTSEIGRGICVVDYSGLVWFSPSPARSDTWQYIGTLTDTLVTNLKFINVI